MEKEKMNRRKLTDEELAQVSGGSSRDRYLLHQEVLMQTLAEEMVHDSDPVEQPEQPTGGHTSGVKVEPGYEYSQWLQD